jgi:predicted HTH domain antitoxin
MTIEIADHVLQQSKISIDEVLLRIALSFFQEERVTLSQAAKIADIHAIQFQMELSKRNIPIHYGEAEYLQDLQTLKTL